MTNHAIFSQQIVTPQGVLSGHVHVEDGAIAAIEAATNANSDAFDCGDDLLIPGLVDIHTDNLEKHYQPRPGARWDSLGAALAHDGQCIMFQSNLNYSRALWRPPGQCGPSLHRVGNETAFQKKVSVEHTT